MSKAVQINRYGEPTVMQLMEVVLPPVLPTEVRFKVVAAPVNRADLEIRSGNWQIMASNPFPYTPGLEAAGTITEVGSAVEGLKVGDNVITMMQKLGGIHGIRAGGYQEYVTVEAANVAVIPVNIEVQAVAALGLAAVTALNGLNRMELQPGNKVVIHGASGGVGTLAVQIALLLGLRVIATTNIPTKNDYLLKIGAEQVINLKQTSLVQELGARSINGVLETIGQATFADSVAVLAKGGRLCLVGAASGDDLHFVAWDLLQDLVLTGYSSENMTGDDLRRDIAQLCGWLAEGTLPVPPYQTFKLAEAAQVHTMMEERQITGRALLIP